MNKKILFVIFALLVAGVLYVSWYSISRSNIIARNTACAESATMCPLEIVPRSIWEIITGKLAGLTNDIPCDQSATTTPCEVLNSLPQTPPPPYVPENTVSPIDEWTSVKDIPVKFAGFSFSLPPGWHGSVYNKGGGGLHLLAEQRPGMGGFTIDCPPDGKGLETATRLSVEERTFAGNGISYTASFEKWTAPGNEPWIFVFIREKSSSCTAQGSADPDTAGAMHMLYETLSR